MTNYSSKSHNFSFDGNMSQELQKIIKSEERMISADYISDNYKKDMKTYMDFIISLKSVYENGFDDYHEFMNQWKNLQKILFKYTPYLYGKEFVTTAFLTLHENSSEEYKKTKKAEFETKSNNSFGR